MRHDTHLLTECSARNFKHNNRVTAVDYLEGM